VVARACQGAATVTGSKSSQEKSRSLGDSPKSGYFQVRFFRPGLAVWHFAEIMFGQFGSEQAGIPRRPGVSV
jgi:hypothetical protein